MAVDFSVYKQPTLSDYMRRDAQEKFDRQLNERKLAVAGGRGNDPAAVKIVNDMQNAARASQDPNLPPEARRIAAHRYTLLNQVAKSYGSGPGMQNAVPDDIYGAGGGMSDMDAGMPAMGQGDPMDEFADAFGELQRGGQLSPYAGQNPRTTPMPLPAVSAVPGYDDILANRGARVKGAEEQAKADVNLNMNPQILEAEEQAKADVDRRKRIPGQQRLTSNLSQVAELYNELDRLGAAVNPKKSTWGNINARVASSWLGQAAGGAIGTPEQAIRDEIKAMRPTLMNDIRQATEMGARGLDSEKELEFYLSAVTDPRRSLPANMAALSVLNNAYALGSGQFKADPAHIEALQREFSEAIGPQKSGGMQGNIINWEDLP